MHIVFCYSSEIFVPELYSAVTTNWYFSMNYLNLTITPLEYIHQALILSALSHFVFPNRPKRYSYYYFPYLTNKEDERLFVFKARIQTQMWLSRACTLNHHTMLAKRDASNIDCSWLVIKIVSVNQLFWYFFFLILSLIQDILVPNLDIKGKLNMLPAYNVLFSKKKIIRRHLDTDFF